MSGHHVDEATYKSQVNAVWRATTWLAIITIVEVIIALLYIYMFKDLPRILINSFFVAASLLKAFFIIAEFMHLKYEKRALIITLAVPIIFLVWAIIAFAWDGTTWLHMKGY
jgi:cytochrome c oxidase subunit 4